MPHETHLSEEQKAQIRAVLPLLREIQKSYRGTYFLKPAYREAKYAEIFEDKNGANWFDAIAFLNYLQIETQESEK